MLQHECNGERDITHMSWNVKLAEVRKIQCISTSHETMKNSSISRKLCARGQKIAPYGKKMHWKRKFKVSRITFFPLPFLEKCYWASYICIPAKLWTSLIHLYPCETMNKLRTSVSLWNYVQASYICIPAKLWTKTTPLETFKF
jgi:hypothetical protein